MMKVRLMFATVAMLCGSEGRVSSEIRAPLDGLDAYIRAAMADC